MGRRGRGVARVLRVCTTAEVVKRRTKMPRRHAGFARFALFVFLFWIFVTMRLGGQPQGEWPQFRGPTGQGHSAEHGLPFEWSETRNVVWKSPIRARGWSSPVITNGGVWVTPPVTAT